MEYKAFDEMTPLEQAVATCRNPERKAQAAAELARLQELAALLVTIAPDGWMQDELRGDHCLLDCDGDPETHEHADGCRLAAALGKE